MARSKKQARRIAIGAARSEIRRMGLQPQFYTPKQALEVLDDLLRKEPDLVASQWYATATDHQIDRFWKEWASWCKETVEAIRQPIEDADYRSVKE